MDLDVAIIGGGPAGVATALFLAAAAPHLRDRLAILEKDRYPREKICAGALGARADRLLATLGVRVEVPSVPIHGLSVTTSCGARHAHNGDEPIGRVVRRIEFDRAFAAQARDRGIRILEGARVTGIAFERDAVIVRSSLGDLRARAVVGADGVGSVVRRALGVPRGRWIAQVVETDTSAASSDGARDTLAFDLGDRSFPGYGWDFPTLVGGQPLICRGLYELHPGAIDPAPEGGRQGDVSARLLARLDRLGVEPGKLKRFAERGLSLHEPLAVPRALLVGEAAGIDPALGEGIAQAIFYGAAAGPYLARCLDRDDLGFADWPRDLRRSRVGLDLGIRTRATPWLYGRTRPLAERWMVGSGDLAVAGMCYFAGKRVPRLRIAGAGADLCRDALGALGAGARAARSSVAATFRRPWW